MNRDEIISQVIEYLQDDTSNSAIMISGIWGCGKTHLYKHYLADEITKLEAGKNKRRKNFYISLYGIKSVEDLSKEVIISFMTSEWNNEKNAKQVIKTADGVASILSKSISFSSNGVGVKLEDLFGKIRKMLKAGDMVICFDDLERSNIQINELFGFIDNLTEHCNCKVILLADEKNIGKMYANTNLENKYLTVLSGGRKVITKDEDKTNISKECLTFEGLKKLCEEVYSENYIYRDIKEKVIGNTLYYTPSTEETLNDLFCAISKGDYKNCLIAKQKFILDKFLLCGNDINYRIVGCWIRKFKKIYDELHREYNSHVYYDSILDNYLIYSIYCICMDMNNISFATGWEPNSYAKRIVRKKSPFDKILAHRFIDEWVIGSRWNKIAFYQSSKELIEAFKRNEELLKQYELDERKHLRKLAEWRSLSDDEVKTFISEVISELAEGLYSFYDFPQILEDLIFFKRLGLYDGNLNEVGKYMHDQLLTCEDEIEFNTISREFVEEDDRAEFLRIYKPLEEEAKQHNLSLGKDNIAKKFDDAQSFRDYCSRQKQFFAEEKCFVGYVGVDMIVEMIKKSSREEIYKITQGIKEIYNFADVSDIFKQDRVYLEELNQKIKEGDFLSDGITDQCAKDTLIGAIDDILVRLSDDEEKQEEA
ncbi:P-loop NTPase fold protein [Butyrivibrio sp. AD3002]|uniref:P-loop NTPase fold protein n=1 Tax=Butyrivibrio sp. AD3002 TaxID=1280670 RepID=UPI0003B31081|nr:P-loop NTPase fold protein [Butyrivibrio sp. AD3002]